MVAFIFWMDSSSYCSLCTINPGKRNILIYLKLTTVGSDIIRTIREVAWKIAVDEKTDRFFSTQTNPLFSPKKNTRWIYTKFKQHTNLFCFSEIGPIFMFVPLIVCATLEITRTRTWMGNVLKIRIIRSDWQQHALQCHIRFASESDMCAIFNVESFASENVQPSTTNLLWHALLKTIWICLNNNGNK